MKNGKKINLVVIETCSFLSIRRGLFRLVIASPFRALDSLQVRDVAKLAGGEGQLELVVVGQDLNKRSIKFIKPTSNVCLFNPRALF